MSTAAWEGLDSEHGGTLEWSTRRDLDSAMESGKR